MPVLMIPRWVRKERTLSASRLYLEEGWKCSVRDGILIYVEFNFLYYVFHH